MRTLWRDSGYVRYLVGMVSQMYIMSNLSNVYFEYVQVILCQLQLNKAVKKKKNSWTLICTVASESPGFTVSPRAPDPGVQFRPR